MWKIVTIKVCSADCLITKDLRKLEGERDILQLDQSDLSDCYKTHAKISRVLDILPNIAAKWPVADLYIIFIPNNDWNLRFYKKISTEICKDNVALPLKKDGIREQIWQSIEILQKENYPFSSKDVADINRQGLARINDRIAYYKINSEMSNEGALKAALDVSKLDKDNEPDANLQKVLGSSNISTENDTFEETNGAVGGISPSTNFNNGLSEKEALEQALQASLAAGQGPSGSAYNFDFL